MHKINVHLFTTFTYKQFVGSLSQNFWSGNKFDVTITDSNTLKEYKFKVKPHWYANEDYHKALEMAKEYIDRNF